MFETSLLFEKLPTEDKSSRWHWRTITLASVVVAVGLGMACLAWGTWLYFKPFEQHLSDIPLLNLDQSSSIYVDVGGAVSNPGIYPLEEGERMAAAIDAAGGLASDADTDYLNTTLNLSAKLKDEQKIYIPFVGEKISSGATTDLTEIPNVSTTQLVSINTATESELDELPKIGPTTAQKIIDGRPYTTIDDLVTKKIVSETVLAEIKALVKI